MRLATPDDAHLILEMMMDCYIENQKEAPRDVGFNVFKARKYIEDAIDSPGAILYFAPNGVIIATYVDTFWGDNYFLSTSFFYVKPEARNGLLARRMFRLMEFEAKWRGLKYLVVSPQYKPSTTFLDSLLKRIGFEHDGGIYAKHIS